MIESPLKAVEQEAIADILSKKAIRACQRLGVSQLVLGGGVAANTRLRELNSAMMHAQEDERRRLSRDLHDDLGQLLSVTTMNLEQGLDEADMEGRERALTRALASATRAVESARASWHANDPDALAHFHAAERLAEVMPPASVDVIGGGDRAESEG